MSKVPVIQETKPVWVAYTNTDLTEGRGYQRPKFVCETKATAIRLGRKGYVMGSDCPVEEKVAVKINNQWLVPGVIEWANDADKAAQLKIDQRAATVAKAKAAGLSDDEIKLLGK